MFGSLSVQPNGDRFIGWGSARDISQHKDDGSMVFYAEIGDDDVLVGSLRAFKAPWVGRPLDEPAVYGYARGCGWRTVVYVSWNGATEVRSYRVFGAGKRDGQYVQVAFGPKDGFETRLRADRFMGYTFVEALSHDGLVLGRSNVVRTYVPPPVEARGCSEWKCPATITLPHHECHSQDDKAVASAGGLDQVPLD